MAEEATTTAVPENQPTPATPTAPSPDAPAPVQPGPSPTDPTPTLEPGPEPTDTPPKDVGDLQRFREQLAGGDEGILKGLERYKSIEAISKAFKEARQAVKNAGKPLPLSDKATEDEVKAYREAYGIPADAKDYPGAFRDGFKASDFDNTILGDFKTAMHERNVPPAAAAAALDWYQDFATAQKQELDGNLAKVAKQTQADLRTEWGGEYDGNIGAVQELMKSHLGEDGFNGMMSMRMMDGSRLQDHPGFVKMMAQIATDYYGSNAIFNGDIETTSKTIDEKLADYRKMQTDDPEKYRSPAVQEAVAALYAQKEKLDARKR